MVSGALLGVVAQRLVRRVCAACRIVYVPSSTELARFGLSSSQNVAVAFYKAKSATRRNSSQSQRPTLLRV